MSRGAMESRLLFWFRVFDEDGDEVLGEEEMEGWVEALVRQVRRGREKAKAGGRKGGRAGGVDSGGGARKGESKVKRPRREGEGEEDEEGGRDGRLDGSLGSPSSSLLLGMEGQGGGKGAMEYCIGDIESLFGSSAAWLVKAGAGGGEGGGEGGREGQAIPLKSVIRLIVQHLLSSFPPSPPPPPQRPSPTGWAFSTFRAWHLAPPPSPSLPSSLPHAYPPRQRLVRDMAFLTTAGFGLKPTGKLEEREIVFEMYRAYHEEQGRAEGGEEAGGEEREEVRKRGKEGTAWCLVSRGWWDRWRAYVRPGREEGREGHREASDSPSSVVVTGMDVSCSDRQPREEEKEEEEEEKEEEEEEEAPIEGSGGFSVGVFKPLPRLPPPPAPSRPHQQRGKGGVGGDTLSSSLSFSSTIAYHPSSSSSLLTSAPPPGPIDNEVLLLEGAGREGGRGGGRGPSQQELQPGLLFGNDYQVESEREREGGREGGRKGGLGATCISYTS